MFQIGPLLTGDNLSNVISNRKMSNKRFLLGRFLTFIDRLLSFILEVISILNIQLTDFYLSVHTECDLPSY